MQVTVFGAGGKVGRLVAGELLARGHQVVAVIHSTSPFFTEDPGLRVIKGDVYEAGQVTEALHGSQAVISALGSWGTPAKDIQTVGMANIAPAMQAQGIRRIVSITGAGAFAPNDVISKFENLSHMAMNIAAGKVLYDGEAHIKLLQNSGLDWTVLRSPIMTSNPATQYRLQTNRPLPWALISRYTIAHVMADQLEDVSFIGQSPYVTKL
jgi:putative NADH-flavin reductase